VVEMKRTMKEYVANVHSKMQALVLVGNLLAGNITVNIDDNKMTEATKDEQLFDTEFRNMLKALGVENVPVEILARCGQRTTIEYEEITIDDVTEQIDEMTAKGLLHELYIGTTQVDVTTGAILWCYGGYDGKEHGYATIKACAGRHINAQDVSEMYADSWLAADIEDKEAVEKIVNLIRG
jgi:hypothetical protein